MVGTYASLLDVRRLAGGIGSIPDADMEDFMFSGNVLAEGCTGLKDLSPSDGRYVLMEQLAEFYASAIVRDHFSDKLKQANTHWERAKELCAAIVALSSGGSTSARNVSQGYKTSPLNEDGDYFSDRFISSGVTENIFD
jgi:hypothetical protein